MINVDSSGLDDGLPFAQFQFADLVNRWAADVGPVIRDTMRNQAPRRTGRLEQSIGYEVGAGQEGGGGNTFELRIKSYGVPYTGYVVGGTEAHEIRAVAAKALHFYWNGGTSGFMSQSGEVFFKRVHHPGTKANNFPERTYQATRDYMESRMLVMLDQMISGQGA